jgi:hypothetical protein
VPRLKPLKDAQLGILKPTIGKQKHLELLEDDFFLGSTAKAVVREAVATLGRDGKL